MGDYENLEEIGSPRSVEEQVQFSLQGAVVRCIGSDDRSVRHALV